MTFCEVQGNLFNSVKDCYMAHCISADYALGAGIALQFANKMDMRSKLFQKYGALRGKRETVGKSLLVDHVFKLVTKERYFHKPTYGSLEASLLDMKNQCSAFGVTKLAMPRIGCGLDRLNWDDVSRMIQRVFADTEIEVMVYSL